MRKDLTARGTVEIKAPPAKIWKVLTDPIYIKEYLFGTEALTDWKPGSSIVFQGEYQGQQYRDKGIVQENVRNKLLSYTYWSKFSGLEDKPENYSLVTYQLRDKNDGTSEFTWSQQGFATKEGYQHSQEGMKSLLGQIADIAEKIN